MMTSHVMHIFELCSSRGLRAGAVRVCAVHSTYLANKMLLSVAVVSCPPPSAARLASQFPRQPDRMHGDAPPARRPAALHGPPQAVP